MKKAFLEYIILPPEIENDTKNVPYHDLSFPSLFNEFGFGKVIIFEDDGNGKHVYLKKVPILQFIFELDSALQKLKSFKNHEQQIGDYNESYRLVLEKKGDLCRIQKIDRGELVLIVVEFEVLFTNLKASKKKIFESFMRFYPTLSSHKDYDKMKSFFGMS